MYSKNHLRNTQQFTQPIITIQASYVSLRKSHTFITEDQQYLYGTV